MHHESRFCPQNSNSFIDLRSMKINFLYFLLVFVGKLQNINPIQWWSLTFDIALVNCLFLAASVIYKSDGIRVQRVVA